jgi:hypothetical protein
VNLYISVTDKQFLAAFPQKRLEYSEGKRGIPFRLEPVGVIVLISEIRDPDQMSRIYFSVSASFSPEKYDKSSL